MSTDLTDPAAPPPDAAPAAAADDPFQRLHKMSTTAGVGAGDYVAINAAAIAALLAGVASGTVLFGLPILLLLPLAGVVLGVLAFVQIGRSNGTQAGRGLAAIGLGLSLGLGGYQGWLAAVRYARGSAAEGAVVDLVHGFGADLAAGRYKQAYDRCDPSFRQRVNEAQFEGTWQANRHSQVLGDLKGIDWNGQLQFDTDRLTGQPVAGGMVLMGFSKADQPSRTELFYRQVDGRWLIDGVPRLFPTATGPADPTNANPSAPSAAEMAGPPRPRGQ